MTENLIKLKGEFTIDVIKDDKIIDSFTDNNLVVDGSRAILASLISGINNPVSINKLSLGTLGHNEDFDKFTPKEVNGEYRVGGTHIKFDETVDKLFCQEVDQTTLDYTFLPPGNSEINVTLPGIISLNETDLETNNSSVSISCTCNSVIYKFEIEQGVGHGMDDSAVTAYTEAGLFSDNILFCIKTFPAKVKDNATKFVITWKIFT